MRFLTFVLCLLVCHLNGQHTFSIVAADPTSKEVGSAGATCLDNIILNGEEGALTISDIIPGKGAINTQAWWSPFNMSAALDRMESGDSPEEIIDWLKLNDNSSGGGNINDRQYGIVDINNNTTRSAGFTGANNFAEAGQLIGDNYAIQGNILISIDVLQDMEKAFLETNGTLADKLMAAMQGAKRPGADQRCLSEGVSSLSAFLRVAQPTDTDASYGNLSLDLNIGSTPFSVEPIDELQSAYNEYKATVSDENIQYSHDNILIFPNPNSTGKISIKTDQEIIAIQVFSILGQHVSFLNSDSTENIDISHLSKGVYFLQVSEKYNNQIYIQKLKIN